MSDTAPPAEVDGPAPPGVDQADVVARHADDNDHGSLINTETDPNSGTETDPNSGIETERETETETEPETEPEADPEDEAEAVSRLDALRLDEPDALRKAVEAVLFVVDAPVSAEALAAALQRPVPDVETAIAAVRHDLDARGSGVELREIAGGVRLYTRPEWSPAVEAFVLEGQRNKLSQASLETLAVVAYRQPVSRARISAIRGVTVDGVVRTLLARGLLVEAGTDPDTGATLLATTDLFLERMGLSSLSELPSLAPLLPDAQSLSALEDADGLDVDDL